MTCPDYIREALATFANCFDNGESVAVPTQCLYPSNGVVTVFLTGGARGSVVSDEGGSIIEIGNHGIDIRRPDSFLQQFCAPHGLRCEGAKIFSPVVGAANLPSAISLVANASSLAAHVGVRNLRQRPRRDLHKELRTLLGQHWAEERIKEEYRLPGSSGRQYRFDFVVEIGDEKRLVVDAVMPDPQTINTRAIAHFDLGRTEEATFVQRLVYDETDTWSASDINLLRMAAELVPLSHFNRFLVGLEISDVHRHHETH